jgi:hypothetical protein
MLGFVKSLYMGAAAGSDGGIRGMWTVVSGVITLIVAVLIARPLGRALKARPIGWYIAANALAFIVAMGLVFASSAAAPAGTPISDALLGLALGVGFGGLAGLRYGYKGLFELAGAKDRS